MEARDKVKPKLCRGVSGSGYLEQGRIFHSTPSIYSTLYSLLNAAKILLRKRKRRRKRNSHDATAQSRRRPQVQGNRVASGSWQQLRRASGCINRATAEDPENPLLAVVYLTVECGLYLTLDECASRYTAQKKKDPPAKLHDYKSWWDVPRCITCTHVVESS